MFACIIALVTRHAKCTFMRRMILSVACRSVPHFATMPHKGTLYGKQKY